MNCVHKGATAHGDGDAELGATTRVTAARVLADLKPNRSSLKRNMEMNNRSGAARIMVCNAAAVVNAYTIVGLSLRLSPEVPLATKGV